MTTTATKRRTRKPRPDLRLVPQGFSQDTVERLEELLDLAYAGELIGFVGATMFKRRSYRVEIVGEARGNATFARGVLRTIDDELGARIRAVE
ncbi:MAG TPA: hypothetical protein VGE10_06715 [Zeimonas sp.]